MTSAKLVGMKKINDFGNEEIQLLEARTELYFNEESEICNHYKKVYLIRYESIQKWCSDRFNTHGKKKVLNKSLCMLIYSLLFHNKLVYYH